jgi:hypothetical protein
VWLFRAHLPFLGAAYCLTEREGDNQNKIPRIGITVTTPGISWLHTLLVTLPLTLFLRSVVTVSNLGFFSHPQKKHNNLQSVRCALARSRGSPHRNTTPLALRNQLTLKPGQGRTENRRSCSPSPAQSSSVLRSTAAEPPILQIQGRAREPNPVYSFTCETRHHTSRAFI